VLEGDEAEHENPYEAGTQKFDGTETRKKEQIIQRRRRGASHLTCEKERKKGRIPNSVEESKRVVWVLNAAQEKT